MTAITTARSSTELLSLARANSLQYTADAIGAASDGEEAEGQGSLNFGDTLLKAMEGVNADQQASSSLVERMLVAPDSVDAHDVTVAMAEANLSLNLARTIMDRVVRGWKEVINTR
jgi:flagellar hook-basal body complex protein FliE